MENHHSPWVQSAWLDPCYHQACDILSTSLGSPPLDAQGFIAAGRPGAAAAVALAGNAMVGSDQTAYVAAHAAWCLTMADDPLGSELTLTVPKRAGSG